MSLHKFLLLLLLPLTALAQPSQPQLNDANVEEARKALRRFAYASFLASSCDFNDPFPDEAKKFVGIVSQYKNRSTGEMEATSRFFDDHRSNHANNSNWWSIFKRCNFEKGKTRIFLDSVKSQSEEISKRFQKPLSDYLISLDSYNREQERLRLEREAAERAKIEREKIEAEEKTARQARQIVDETAQYIVDNRYKGGRELMKRVIGYEYYEPTQTYRIKVELEWRGRTSGDSGYAANGVIEATYQNFDRKWRLGDNLKWHPGWVSPALDRFLKCTTSIFSLMDCM